MGSQGVFKFFVMVVSSSSRVALALRGRVSFGFCGSRSTVPPTGVWSAVLAALPGSFSVSCGCVGGLCALARSSFPGASVFSASSFGFGRSAFAQRSIALVQSVAASPSPVWVSFPASSCPAGLVPSASSSRCFRGLGSGSWASLAFAVGLGVRAVVWLPPGVVFPSGWGALQLGGGWWLVLPTANISTFNF